MLQWQYYEFLDLGKLHLNNRQPYHRAGSHLIHSFVWHQSWTTAWDVRVSINANRMPYHPAGPGFRSHDRKCQNQPPTQQTHFLETRCEHRSVSSTQSLLLCPSLKDLTLGTEEPGMAVLTASRWRAASKSLVQGSGMTGKCRAEMSLPSLFIGRFSKWIGSAHRSNGVFSTSTPDCLLC